VHVECSCMYPVNPSTNITMEKHRIKSMGYLGWPAGLHIQHHVTWYDFKLYTLYNGRLRCICQPSGESCAVYVLLNIVILRLVVQLDEHTYTAMKSETYVCALSMYIGESQSYTRERGISFFCVHIFGIYMTHRHAACYLALDRRRTY
jgi:hypothetical protein